MIFSTSARLRGGLVKTLAVAAAFACSSAFYSCKSVIEDDLPECAVGLELRFIYDYNMEFANAFPSQVDCLTVFIYDEEGKYVTTRTQSGDPLADESYRMTVDLDPGTYTVLAYGGMECGNSSFHFTAPPSGTLLRDVEVEMNDNVRTSPEGTRLHPLFYGTVDATVESNETLEYQKVTVPMMKDTNNIRILLQNLNGEPLAGDDFTFSITDDNTLFNYANELIPDGGITYCPWVKGQESAGILENGETATLAFAELSTSRLMAGHDARLVISRAKDGKKIIDIPLVNYLLLLKSQEFDKMGSQEFLDRESRWNLTFFLLGDDTWMNAYIRINDWIVRINEAEL